MADGDIGDPGGSGFQLPDAPGDFSETVPNQQTAPPGSGKRPDPFTPLTPAQEHDERTRLNFEAGRRATLLGSAQAADAARQATGLSPEQRAGYQQDLQTGLAGTGSEMMPVLGEDNPNFDAQQDDAKDRLSRMQSDQQAYENMPAYKGVVEGLYSLAGQVGGGMTSPENLVFPEVKFGSVAWRAGHPFMADVIGYGLGQAAIQGPANIVTQTNQVKAGLKKEFDPVEASLAFPLGFAFGSGLTAIHAGGAALYRYGKDALDKWAVDGVMRGPQLTPEVRPPVAPEPPRAPVDTFEEGAPQQTAAVPQVPAVGGMPMPVEGTTRLYRTAHDSDKGAQHILFSTTPFPGANEFIDVPASVAAERLHAPDRVSLPAEYAGVRQDIPEPTTAPAKPEAPSVFQNLTDFDKAVKGTSKEPQGFTQWVRSQGGLRPDAELDALFGRKRPDLIRTNGKSLDQIREAAVEQGWIPDQGRETGGVATSSTEDVLKLLGAEERGTKQVHPKDEAQAAKIAQSADLKKTMADIDGALRDMNEHPSQVTGKAQKAAARDIRNRAVEIAHTEDVHPEIAVERALQEYGEHAAAAEGQPRLVEGHPDIPFDHEPAPAEGGRAGEVGAPGGGADAQVAGGAQAPSAAEREIATRLKGMAGQGIGVAPGATRPGAGVASANHVGTLTPLENLQQMMRRISDALELIVRKGVHEKGALGQYDFRTGIARIKDLGPDGVATWAHEVGHDIERRMGTPLVDLITTNMASMKAFAGVMGNGLDPRLLAREGFGEFMAGYITNRPNLELKDPVFVKAFRKMMVKENPELLAILDDAHASFERYNAAPSGQAVDSMIVSHGEVPKVPANDPLQRGPVAQWFGDAYLKYVNKQSPITVAVRYLAREIEKREGKLLDLRPDQDPKALAQILGDAGFQKTVMDLTYGIQSLRDLTPEGPSYLSIIRRATSDPLTGREVATPAEYLARLKSWDAYKVARWHIELRRQMSNGEIDLNRMPTGMTDGDAALKVAEAEQMHPNWPALAEEEYAFQKAQANLEHEAGLRSTESLAEIMHPRNHMYVPLYRDMRGITDGLGIGGPGSRIDKPLEELGFFQRTGSGRNIRSPTETSMERMHEINTAAHQNMIVTALRDLVNRAGPAGAHIAEMVPSNQLRAMDINVEEAVFRAAKAAGWLDDDAKSLVRNLQQELGPDIRTKLYRQEAIKAGGQPIIFGWENGERFAMRLPDGEYGKSLVETMDSLGPKGMSAWAQAGGLVVDALSFTSSTLRAGATGTPTFMAKNLLRDAFMQYLLVPEAGVDTLAMANAVRGGRSYLMGDDFYRMYSSLGGIRGGIGAAGLSRSSQQVEFERAIRGYTGPGVAERSQFSSAALQQSRVEAAATLGAAGVEPHRQIFFGSVKELMSKLEISESAGRVGLFRAVYDANIAMGRDERYAMFDAAQKARDFIDYGRMGSKMEAWSRLVPFLNANIQGIDKFMRTYVGTPSSPGMFFKPFTQQQLDYQHALRVQLGTRAAAIAAISAGISYVWEDDPVYQRLSVQQRAQNWWFRVPFLKSGSYTSVNGSAVDLPEGMQGAWISIPKPWEPGTIFNLAEKAVEFIHSGDSKSITDFIKSIRYTFSVPNPLELPLVRATTGLAANYDDFFQRPIVPDSMKGIAPHMQANEYTNKFYVALAQGLNMVWASQDAHTWFKNNIPVVGALLASPWSPMEAQYMMQGMFGDWPRELGGIGGIGRSLINGMAGNDMNLKMSDVPALRAFVKDRMAMGEPMNELYNQIGQNGGRLTVANKSFTDRVKSGDVPGATQYFNALDDSERDYVRIHQVQGGPLANVLHPLDRSSALASVTRAVKNGLLADGGLATLKDPNVRIKLEDGKRDVLIQAMNEFTATEARNGLIVQGASGYKSLPIVDTKPYLDTISKISPELGKELSARLAQAKVMPIESIEKYWPEAQRALRQGDSVDPNQLSRQLKAISTRAALSGYEGGGRKAGRGAVDVGGATVKRGKAGPVSLPAQQ